MPFSLTPSSFPPPPPTQMSAEAAEAAASQRDFEELLGMGPNDFGNETKPADDMDFITQSFSNTSLKEASLPPPPAPMSAADEAAANEREFEELLGIGPNDYGDKTKSVDDMDVITQSFSNTSLRDKRGGYIKHKSRRHKTRRHKSRRHKTRRHKTRRHKSRRY